MKINQSKLSNQIILPDIGLGTWNMADDNTTIKIIKEALELGYRLIDCSPSYQNQNSIGRAIAESSINRSQIYITSKLRNSERGRENVNLACDRILSELNLDYLDLYLIHWPASKKDYKNWEEINQETWLGMIDLYKCGKVKAIGVSNFMPHHLKSLMKYEVIPMVNQIEFHPGQMENDTLIFCRENEILVEAYSPLGNGAMLQNDELIQISNKYKKSVAQLCLRWAQQNGTIPIPRASNSKQLKENIDIFDFQISNDDMKIINEMNYFAGSGQHPDKVDF
ncbi:aldo/keto reductase [Breznakia pachnodae]|uniref:Diketogulonate reductase-like aldo/keto reductase n=1 Tax=Breznakia pachnodae TaxID=265178 RepID=A0ABU0E3M1_9FIRM|nr:aldo/keto reductase [Breznakia pachnodae]MDQ0361484.1 diketogulonate reductase-like aldo/keto reductase [Breznakia pachnodae]